VALLVGGRAANVAEGYERARESVDTGKAAEVFHRLKTAGTPRVNA
jgi:anthranilate phosphoribosyltransferase